MTERQKRILAEQYFIPITGEDGHFPPAPLDAVAEYYRLKEAWLIPYIKTPGEEPILSLYPVRRNGRLRYAVTQAIFIYNEI